MMLKSRWHDLAELVGIGAIVASLVFVGLQLKQAKDIAIAEQYQTRAMFAVEGARERGNNPALHAFMVNGLRQAYESGEIGEDIGNEYKLYGPEYLIARFNVLGEMLIAYDNYYFQYQRGLMEEEAWTAFRLQLKGLFADSLNRSFFTMLPRNQRNSFMTLCDELIEEIQAQEGLAD